MIRKFTNENLEEFVKRANECNLKHGWDTRIKNIHRSLMLIITEVSEAVEADRNDRHADLDSFQSSNMPFFLAFLQHIKGSVEEELADVCIRIFSTCAGLGIYDLEVLDDDNMESFLNDYYKLYGNSDFATICYHICYLLCDMHYDEFDDDFMCILAIIWCYCERNGIDLLRHIELKMEFNEHREWKHGGKKY